MEVEPLDGCRETTTDSWNTCLAGSASKRREVGSATSVSSTTHRFFPTTDSRIDTEAEVIIWLRLVSSSTLLENCLATEC